MTNKLDTFYGVPHGSVLAPILFNIYVSDLSDFISGCDVIQYANDTQFIHTGCIKKITDFIHMDEKLLGKQNCLFI